MKSRNRKLLFILFVCIILMGVGYAFLRSTLTINGVGGFSANRWLIYFDEIRPKAGSVTTATKPAIITNPEKTNIQFDVDLNMPGEFYEFDVYIKNDGTIDAMIDEVIMPELTEEQLKYMKFTYTYIDGTPLKKCDELKAQGFRDTRLRVEYLEDADLEAVPDDGTTHFDVTITYVQESECELDEIEVDLDPNGGLYNETTEVTTVTLSNGQTYDVGIPTREGYTFVKWLEVTNSESYENNQVVFKGRNVRLQAQWLLSDDVVARIDREESIYYVTIQAAIDDARNGEMIYLLKNTSEVFTNNKNVTLNLQGYKVTGSGTNQEGYSFTIINGSIENEDGIGFTNHGTLTLGIDDENVCDVGDKTHTCAYEDGFVSILGTTRGIVQNGTMNFYDGFVEGELAIVGPVNKTPILEELGDGTYKYYIVFVDHDVTRDDQKAYLSAAPTRAVSKTIVGGNIYYFNLQDNVNTSSATGYRIYAIRNFEGAYNITISDGEPIVFDIIGYTVDIGNDIIVNGDFKIMDSAETKGSLNISHPIALNDKIEFEDVTVTVASTNANLINNASANTIKLRNSTLKSQNGVVLNNNSFTGESLLIDMDETSYIEGNTIVISSNKPITTSGGNIRLVAAGWDGAVVMNGAKLTVNGTDISEPNSGRGTVRLNNGASLEINSGKISNSNEHAILCERNNTVQINGGEVYASTNAIYYCNLTMDGGKVSGYTYAVRNGNFTLNDGLVEGLQYGGWSVAVETDYLTINGGKIISNATGGDSVAVNSGNVTMNAGEVEGYDSGLMSHHLTLNDGHVKGGRFGVVSLNKSAYDRNYYTVNILGGLIEGGTYGLYHKVDRLVIGVLDDEIKVDSPVIVGGTYGVYKSGGDWWYYDGILKGKTAGRTGVINKMPDASILIEDDTEEINEELYQLAYLAETANYLQVGNKEYNSFNKLFEKEEGENITIEVLDDGNIVYPQTIPSGRIIVLNLNGHTINTTQVITVNSPIVINDDLVEEEGEQVYKGKIISGTTTPISSTSNITLNGGSYYTTAGWDNYTFYFSGSGKLTFNDGYIESNTRNCIKLDNSSSFEMNGGTLHKDSEQAIDCSNKNGVIITDGLIEGNADTISNCSVTMDGGKVTGYTRVFRGGYLTLNDGLIEGKATGGTAATVETDTLTMNGGKITGAGTGRGTYGGDFSTAVNSGTVVLNDGEIEAVDSGIIAHYLTVNGGHIKGGRYGVVSLNKSAYDRNYYLATILGGLIEGGDYGYYQKIDRLVIGVLDDTIHTDSPVIIGGTYGVYKTAGSWALYDGILKGKEAGKYGLIDTQPDGAVLNEDDTQQINEETYHLAYLTEMEDFLQVGEHTYNSFNKLFENEEDIDITIEVIANGDFMYPQTIPSGRNVTLKLNSHTVTTTHTITNNSPIIIKDDLVEEDGEQIYKGTLNCKNGTVLSQTGNLTLNGGNIIDSSGSYEAPSILMNNGKLTINKGKVDNYGGMTIKLKSSSSIEVNGGVINQTSSTAIYCESSNAITINDGLISGVKNVIYNCITTMEGGKVTGNNGVISGGTFTLNDGFVEGKSTWETTSTVTPSTAYINGGKITSGATGTGTYGGDSSACLNAATATVTGGTFECSHTGIWARWLTMSGGTIKAGKYGIRTLMRGGYDGTYYKRTITGGTIEGGVYGIYHELDNLVIGTKDGTIDATTPVIIGGTYGVYKGSGDISFYDGIIKGLTDAINKTYENIEDASQIKVGVETKTVDEEEVQYTTHNLIYEYEFITNTTQNKNYKNFNDAILEANNNDKFEVFKSVDVYKEFTIDKNITIDLKGNKITLARIATIDEGAVVTIKDTGETPKGFDTLLYNKLIINNGTLTLQDIKFKTYYANDYLVVNNGTLTMNNCTLNGEYGVSSAEGSTLNINGGIIDVNKLGISNSGNLTLTGGTYNVDTSTYGTVYFLVTGGESINTITDITTNGGVSISANSVGTITTSTIKSNSANSGKLTITDTDYIQTERGCGAVISNSGEFLMTGGEFTISNAKDCNSCKNAFINNSGKMKIKDTPLTFSDSELGGKVGIYTNSSQGLELENLNITANLTANMYNSFSIVSVAGGEFKSNKVNMSSNVNVPYVNSSLYGISISGGEANLKETDISVNATNSYGMYLSGGTINMINDNEFKATGTNTFGAYFDGGTLYMATNNNALKSTGSTSYGAYINTATGKLLLGEREEEGTPNYGTENADVSTTDPYIEAIGSSTGYGIYNTNGYYEFGDGKVLGSTKARNGNASEVEYLWEITEYTDEETGYQYCVLEFMDE